LSPARLEIDLELDQGREIHVSLGSTPPAGGGVYLAVAGQEAVHVVDKRVFADASQLLDRSVGAARPGAEEKEPER
jgi:hypothetical protein